jgi:hypothetical protein
MPERLVRSNFRMAVALMIIVMGLLAAFLSSYYLSIRALNQNNANWCDTLSLLTAQSVPAPSNPAANPSREEAYRLYLDFVVLKHRFNCP